MIILIVAVCVLLICVALYFYWLYAPIPREPALSSTIHRQHINVDGYERTYRMYVPPRSNHQSKLPLLIVLHGSGIDGARMRAWTGFEFDVMADQYSFAVAYPDGYGKNWNDIRKMAPFKAKEKNIDDVGFIKALIEQHRSANNIDTERIYAFGYSNGGNFAFRLAMQERGLLAGIATVAANLPTPDNRIVDADDIFMPILMVNGTKDRIIPYNGGKINFFGKKMGSVVSTLSTIETFLSARSEVTMQQSWLLPHSSSKNDIAIEKRVWNDGEQIVAELYTIHEGGHVIPQGVARFPRLMGKVTSKLNAPRAAVAFFRLDKI